jgi:hypothetical protein
MHAVLNYDGAFDLTLSMLDPGFTPCACPFPWLSLVILVMDKKKQQQFSCGLGGVFC